MEITQKQVCEDIIRLLGTFKRALHNIGEQEGITHIQISVLYCVSSYGELPMGKMADALHCDPSNVTGLVDRLVGQGLLSRQESPTDRRTKTLRLTPKGKAFMAQVYKQLPAQIGCDKLNQQELQGLHDLIGRVIV